LTDVKSASCRVNVSSSNAINTPHRPVTGAPGSTLSPYEVVYEPYYPAEVVFYLQLLLFSGLAFFVLLPLMKRTITISLNTD